MKKILVFAFAAVVALTSCGVANAQFTRDDVTISLDQVHLDASLARFDKANKENQTEILNELLRQANKVYLDCETIEEVYELRQRLDLIERSYLAVARKQVVRQVSIRHAIDALQTKILKTIREYEGGTLIFNDTNR